MARKAGTGKPVHPSAAELERKSPASKAKLVMITGLSGSGKITALKVFEDMGYYCVDNLPAELIPSFAQLIEDTRDNKNAAIVVDIREGSRLEQLAGDHWRSEEAAGRDADLSGHQRQGSGAALQRNPAASSPGCGGLGTDFDYERAAQAGADPQHRRSGDRHFKIQRPRAAHASGGAVQAERGRAPAAAGFHAELWI